MFKRLKRLLTRNKTEGGRPAADNDFWYNLAAGYSKVAGQLVSPQTAQKVATVYACGQVIAESVAMLPVNVYRNVGGNRTEEANDHPIAKLLREGPNPDGDTVDSFEFFESSQLDLCYTGDAIIHTLRSKAGKILAFKHLPAEEVDVKQTDVGVKTYIYKQVTYPASDIFHVRYRSPDGVRGRSPVRVAAGTFGFSQALQQFHAALMENGAFLSGIVESPFAFENDEARDRFMQTFKKYMNGGAENGGKWGLLEQGLKYTPHQQTNRDAQLIELSRFSVIELAKIYRMPPIMIQELEKGMAYSSVEQMAIMFVQYTIQPWVTRWERAIKYQLLRDEPDLFVRFNISALIRGDLKSRIEALVQQIKYGLKTINEGRTMLDENPLDSEIGDEVLLDVNLKTSTQLLNEPVGEEEVEPKAQPAAEEPAGDKEAEASAAGQNNVRAAFAPLLQVNLEHLTGIEQKAMRRILKKEFKLSEVEEFYKEHTNRMAQVIGPILASLSKLAGGGEDKQAQLSACTTLLAEHSQAFVQEAKKDQPDYEAVIDSLPSFSGRWVENCLSTFGGKQ